VFSVICGEKKEEEVDDDLVIGVELYVFSFT
jgi:hypothetical protein